MNVWVFILIAAVVSAILRVAPIYLSKLSFINNQMFLTVLDYAACSAIGCMIYLSAFSQFKLSNLSAHTILLFTVNITILLFTFVLSLYLRQPVKTFIISILMYAFILYFVY